MPGQKIAPYGSWKSPITAESIVAENIGIGWAGSDGADIYWVEYRPQENGRAVLVRKSPGAGPVDVVPADFYLRTRVHEYGGRPYLLESGTVYFSNFSDQRIYRVERDGSPLPITPEAALRYADYVFDRRRNLLYAVREDHTGTGEAVNTLVKINAAGDDRGGDVIVANNNFCSTPRLSQDGSKLAWLTWNHPNMPWDGTELWVGDLDEDGNVANGRIIAGGPDESIFQPEWSPDGLLYFVSDRTNWWNLYRLRDGVIEALYPMEAEFGLPQWSFGVSTYCFEPDGNILCTFSQRGKSHLARLNTSTLSLEEIETPYSFIGGIQPAPGGLLFLAGSPAEKIALVRLDLQTYKIEVLRLTSETSIDPGYISVPEEIEFPTENNLTAYGFYYPPANKDFLAPQGERPPLLVKSHGGPTGSTSSVFNEGIQYWTSRGIAVLDVNYGGSTGYGRLYRQRLNGQWGVVDVDDCVNGARYLVRRGDVDEDRLLITGGSAGGYTTLCALTFRDTFKAGASHFGIGDLETLASDTHKFESRYTDNLVGPYPEKRDLYRERSPINFTERLSCPIILFQGSDDNVVPPDQSRKMFEAVRARELPVAYLEFEGEQHGFRKAENIKRSLEAELYFYSRVFGFDLADPVEPVSIENM